MDQVESDSGLSLLSSRERRAAVISGLWLQHGERLREVSPAGSLAAFLRAAHFASDTMLSDDCLDPFNERCAELRAHYVQATREVVAALRARGWSPPDMATTRYRLSASAEGMPLSLAALDFAPDTLSDSSGDFSRPGVGYATAACQRPVLRRPGSGRLVACAPVTFVLSFGSPPESEHSAATLSAYDAFQRDLAPIDGREAPLAADLLSAWRLLRREALAGPGPTLACVTPPSPDEVTVVGLIEPSGKDSAWVERYAALSRSDDLRSRHGFCVFLLGAHETPDRLSRQLLGLLRRGALGNAAERLVPPRSEIFLVPEGGRAARTATALLGQLRRSERSPRARALRQGIVSVRGIFPIAAAAPEAGAARSAQSELAQEASEAGVAINEPAVGAAAQSPAQALAQLKLALAEDTVPTAEAAPPPAKEPAVPAAPLTVSPIL